MLENVKQKTIEPIIRTTIAPGTLIYTDEYDIYGKLTEWGYQHKTVCHSKGEFARDEDGQGWSWKTFKFCGRWIESNSLTVLISVMTSFSTIISA